MVNIVGKFNPYDIDVPRKKKENFTKMKECFVCTTMIKSTLILCSEHHAGLPDDLKPYRGMPKHQFGYIAGYWRDRVFNGYKCRPGCSMKG